MTSDTDSDLLRQFATDQSNEAFAGLVERHVNLVYSVALRQVGDPHQAQEISQAVFLILARKARQLRHDRALSSWLFQTTRLTANNFLRGEMRRQRREQEAYMQSTLNESTDDAWPHIAPMLDTAVESLSEKDRRAIVLRFYEGRNLQEVSLALDATQAAAEKRLNRAVEKLRKFFTKRGIALSAVAIAGAISANSIQAAPAGLLTRVAVVAGKGAMVSTTAATLAQATMKTINWFKLKLAVNVGMAVLAVGSAVLISSPPTRNWPEKLVSGSTETASKVVQTVETAEPREPFTQTTKFTLDSPPGGLALQPAGKIVVGTTLFGAFLDEQSGMLGLYNRGAFRLNPDGSLDSSFLCDVGRHDSAAEMAHLSLGSDGQLLLSGSFDAVEGEPHPGYARLNADGSLDKSFVPWRGSNSVPGRPYLSGGTFSAAQLADGTVAIVSKSVEGKRVGLAGDAWTAYRLAADGTWLIPTNKVIADTFSRPSGLIGTLSGIGFWARRPIDWTNSAAAKPRPSVRYGSEIVDRADSPSVMDMPFELWTEKPNAAEAAIVLKALFEEVPIELCRYALPLADGKTLLAVQDKFIDGSLMAPGRFMLFDSNWIPDLTFTNQFEADRRSRITLQQQPDGKVLIAGLVGTLNGEECSGVVRLERDGQIDHSFHCAITNALDARVMSMVLQNDGHIVVCGFFSEVGGVEVPHIARLNPDGSLDGSFHPAFMTRREFDRERFGKTLKLAVTSLAKESSARAPTNAVPTGPADAPQSIIITSLQIAGQNAEIQFRGSPDGTYILQARDSLSDKDWLNLATNRAAMDGGGSFRDSEAGNHSMRFYRIATP